jgi:hypothetical protein
MSGSGNGWPFLKYLTIPMNPNMDPDMESHKHVSGPGARAWRLGQGGRSDIVTVFSVWFQDA